NHVGRSPTQRGRQASSRGSRFARHHRRGWRPAIRRAAEINLPLKPAGKRYSASLRGTAPPPAQARGGPLACGLGVNYVLPVALLQAHWWFDLFRRSFRGIQFLRSVRNLGAGLRQDFLNHMSMHIRESPIDTVVANGQLSVIDAEQVQDRG